ncbi:MAG: LON peptidase substrate-binding domain-containing protein, partial [Oscillospiraceae bacterium]|nr:LON peptidase substrate-binding domain-containing protein [Oscillospiraceae bacterium]
MSEAARRQMPLLALRGITVFPQMLIHFDVGREKSVRSLESALTSGQLIFLVSQRDMDAVDPTLAELYEVGTVARVCQILRLPGENMRVLVEGLTRARVVDMVQFEPEFIVEVLTLSVPRRRASAQKLEASTRMARELFEAYARLTARVAPDVLTRAGGVQDPGYMADYMAQNMAVSHEEKQAILEQLHGMRRLEQVISLLNREIEILEIQR